MSSRRLLRAVCLPATSLFVLHTLPTLYTAPKESPFTNVPVPVKDVPEVNPPSSKKKRVVVIGSGWAAVSFLKGYLPSDDVTLTVVSPRGYFLYSPLLPAVAVGSLEARSVTEPIRALVPAGTQFFEAKAESIDPSARTVLCSSALDPDAPFRVGYDVLIFAVGSINNTMGTPGVSEHCLFLKSAEDALTLRARLMDAFEKAALPLTTEAERDRLLTFAICGGGPTGSELAGELRDLIALDMARQYPSLAARARILLVESQSHVLSTFDRAIAEYATAKFRKDGIQLILNARVTAVHARGLSIMHKSDGRREDVAAGTVVWATGVGLHPLAASLAKALPPGTQTNTRALVVDDRLRVLGSQGTIYALGDAATVQQNAALAHAAGLFAEFDQDKSGTLELPELSRLLTVASTRYPQFKEHVRRFQEGRAAAPQAHAPTPAAAHKEKASTTSTGWFSPRTGSVGGGGGGGGGLSPVSALAAGLAAITGNEDDVFQALFRAADVDGSGALSLEEFKVLLREMDRHMRTMPATAQVARQQGEYLAAVANARQLGPGAVAVDSPAPAQQASPPPFAWKDMGSMAFIGGEDAVAKLPGVGVLQGIAASALWRGFETSNQQSMRARVAVGLDMARTKVFGRETSSVRTVGLSTAGLGLGPGTTQQRGVKA